MVENWACDEVREKGDKDEKKVNGVVNGDAKKETEDDLKGKGKKKS